MGTLLLVGALGAMGWVGWLLVQEARRRDRVADARGEGERAAQRALAQPGATPDRPEVLESAALVEPRAERSGCPVCGGRVHVLTHDTVLSGEHRQRKVVVRCTACSATHERYYKIVREIAN